LSRFPHLTTAQVGQALTGATTSVRTSAPGAGRGIIDAAQAVSLASSISAAAEPSQPAATASPHQPARLSTTAAHRANAGDLAGSLVRYVVAGLCVLIVLLVGLLLVMRSRRERASGFWGAAAEAAPGRARPRGQHEQRRPEPVPGPVILPGRSQLAPPGWRLEHGRLGGAGGWQGNGLGGCSRPAEPFRPAMTARRRSARTTAAASSPGPPWAPART
jgi:hypothetical protein